MRGVILLPSIPRPWLQAPNHLLLTSLLYPNSSCTQTGIPSQISLSPTSSQIPPLPPPTPLRAVRPSPQGPHSLILLHAGRPGSPWHVARGTADPPPQSPGAHTCTWACNRRWGEAEVHQLCAQEAQPGEPSSQPGSSNTLATGPRRLPGR